MAYLQKRPTASLSGKEADQLLRIIGQLRDRGVSIIYISHRMEEVYMLADRLTILRDGENAGVLHRGSIDPKVVIRTMIGKEVDESACSSKQMRRNTQEIVLEVED